MRVSFKLVLAPIILAVAAFAAPPRTVEQRIRAVENGLIPYVPIQGHKPWNLIDRMRLYEVPAVSIAVIHDYQIDWIKTYGLADPLQKSAASNETRFSAGSISKFANGLLAMRLAQEGKLALDRPVNDFLVRWKIPDNEFTRATPPSLRMLLTHTAATTQAAFFGFQPEQPLPDVVQTLQGTAPAENRGVVVNGPPGKEFRYSGGGTLIAQLAAMDATGQDYAALMEEKVFRPLGMNSSTMRQPLPREFERHAAWPHSDAPWFTGVPYVYPQASAAGLYTTAGDTARMLIEVQSAFRGRGAKILTRESAAEMLRQQASVSEGTYLEHTGIGTFLLQLKANRAGDAGRYFGHSGKNAGFLADALAGVTGGNGVVIMINRDGPGIQLIQELRRAVASVYEWPYFLPPAVIPVKVPARDLDRLTGRFRKGPDEVVSIRRDGGMLIQTINGGARILCVPQSRNQCLLTDFGFVADFQLDELGRAKSFQVVGISDQMPRLADDDLLPNELLLAGRIADGVAEYRKKKLDVWQLTWIASAQIEQKNYAAAAGLLDLALELFPRESIVSRNQGILAERQGNRELAIRCYRRAVELNQSDSDARLRLARMETNSDRSSAKP